MYNFCHPALKPCISVDSVSCDDYPITNLISTKYEKFKRGYLAEYFSKTPVNVTLNFLCPVDIKYIVIFPKVSSQMTNGVEIYTYSGISDDFDDYNFLTKGYCKDLNRCMVFSGLPIAYHSTRLPSFLNNLEFANYRFLSRQYKRVQSMRIEIFKATFTPAIKEIQVWGEISKECDLKMRSTVERIWQSHQTFLRTMKYDCRPDPDLGEYKRKVKDIIPENVEIPEAFLDQLTFEVMTVPMVLPSGNVIDRSTLEQFENVEMLKGHLPYDPFTGLPFEERRKPVISVILKSRIDKFVLENSHLAQFKSIPRRLGECKHTQNRSYAVSKIVQQTTGASQLNSQESSSDKNLENTARQTSISAAKSGPSNLRKRGHDKGKSSNNEVDFNSKRLSLPQFSEERLNLVLQNALSSIRPFVNNSSNDNAPCTEIVCTVCGTKRTSYRRMYKFPCEHLVCRSCLLPESTVKSLVCNICMETYNRSQICRIHPPASSI